MNAADARRIVAEMGLTEHLRKMLDETPPLTAEQIKFVRGVFARNTTRARRRTEPPCDSSRAISKNRSGS